jgi:chromate transporter
MQPGAVTFPEALRFWLKLGFISFGGPAGQIAVMHRELVEDKRWISEQRFLHALNYCMLLPGPEAQQLATYIGWLLHRTWGGIAAGALFVLPSLLLLIVLSWVYVAFGQLGWLAGVLYGIKPAVAAIVLQALLRIGGKTLRHPSQSPLLWGIALASFVALYSFSVPFPAVVLSAGLVGWLGGRWVPGQLVRPQATPSGSAGAEALAPALIDDQTPLPDHARFTRGRLLRVLSVAALLWLLPVVALVAWQGWHGTLATMAWFFTKAALLTFGGAYAVLPYVYQGAVVEHGWLLGPQMIDGLALGETTPGPLIMVVAFVGFLGGWGQQVLGPDAQFLGAALAAGVVTWFTFLPSFVFILAGGPLVESTHGKLHFTAPLTAVTAAVVGVIASLALFFLEHVLWRDSATAGGWSRLDPVALGLVVIAAWALIGARQGVVRVILVSALAGWTLQAMGWLA